MDIGCKNGGAQSVSSYWKYVMYEIEDIGIHEELLRHHGLYYRLYMVQKEMSLSDE